MSTKTDTTETVVLQSRYPCQLRESYNGKINPRNINLYTVNMDNEIRCESTWFGGNMCMFMRCLSAEAANVLATDIKVFTQYAVTTALYSRLSTPQCTNCGRRENKHFTPPSTFERTCDDLQDVFRFELVQPICKLQWLC